MSSITCCGGPHLSHADDTIHSLDGTSFSLKHSGRPETATAFVLLSRAQNIHTQTLCGNREQAARGWGSSPGVPLRRARFDGPRKQVTNAKLENKQNGVSRLWIGSRPLWRCLGTHQGLVSKEIALHSSNGQAQSKNSYVCEIGFRDCGLVCSLLEVVSGRCQPE